VRPSLPPLTIRRHQHDTGTGKKDVDERRNPRQVTKQSVASVVVQLDRAIGMEVYADTRALGRFMLRREGETVAVGVVTKILA
jgi:elongation factor 1 alpha-like protein